MPHLIAAFTISITVSSLAAAYAIELAFAILYSAIAFGVGKLLTPKSSFNLSQDQALRISNQLDPAAPRVYVIGNPRIGGVVSYRESTPDGAGNVNYIFHQILSLAACPRHFWGQSRAVAEMQTIYYGDYPIHKAHLATPIDPTTGFDSGDTDYLVVEQGRYGTATDEVLGVSGLGGACFVEKDRGLPASSLTHFRTLALVSDQWTDAHAGRGIAKIYNQFVYGSGKFPNGIPEVSVRVRGLEFLDPRDAAFPATDFRYSNNPALVILWYLTLPIKEDGCGLEFDDLDLDSFEDAANVCDEFVDINPVIEYVDQDLESSTRKHVDITNNWVYLRRSDGDLKNPCQIVTGDRVRVAMQGAGSLPTGLSAGTDYYAAVVEYNGADAEGKLKLDSGAFGAGNFLPTVAFCTTYADALLNDTSTYVNITAINTGTFTITKVAEPRYTYDNVIDTSRDKREILQEMVQACAGTLTLTGGKWVLKAGAYESPTITLDENDVIGDIDIQTNIPAPEQFNQIVGQYISPITLDNAQNYRPRDSGQGQSEDGRVIPYTLDLPATCRIQMAQRIAKITLLDSRQPIRFSAPFSLAKGLQVRGGDFISFTNERMGWDEKVFRVLSWRFENAGTEDAPLLAVRMDCKETVEDIYDESVNAADIEDPLPGTNLPNPWVVLPPSDLQVAEQKTALGNVRAVAQAVATWNASPDQYVIYYELEYKLEADTEYINIGPIYATTFTVNDIEPGTYDFRVRAINELNRESEWVALQQEIVGLADIPSDPAWFIVIAHEGSAGASWPATVDLDVAFGGGWAIRHFDGIFTDIPKWAESVSIIPDFIAGTATSANIPLKTGWYMLKAIDVLGNECANPAYSFCEQISSVTFTNEFEIRDNPTFNGDKYHVTVNADPALELETSSTLVEPEGTYYIDLRGYDGLFDSHTGLFDDGGDFDSNHVYIDGGGTRRLTSRFIGVLISDISTLFDDHAGLFDDGGDFDGAQAADADAWLEYSKTDDNPEAADAIWQEWARIDSGLVSYTGLKLRVQFRSWQPNTQIEVATLGADIDTA